MALIAAIQTNTSRFERVVSRLDTVLTSPMSSGTPLRNGVEEATHEFAVATQKRFNNASGGDGTWPALAPSTVKKKARQTLFPQRILYLTGALFASLTPGGPGSIYDVLNDRVRYGTRDPKAKFHQAGGGRLPARPIVVAPTPELLTSCTAPIVAAWRETIRACCNAA